LRSAQHVISVFLPCSLPDALAACACIALPPVNWGKRLCLNERIDWRHMHSELEKRFSSL
jgi:hypothetical protein